MVHHVDLPLLQAQLEFFTYVDALFGWINYEGRYLKGTLTAQATGIQRVKRNSWRSARDIPQPTSRKRDHPGGYAA
jgi:hypothetical protein